MLRANISLLTGITPEGGAAAHNLAASSVPARSRLGWSSRRLIRMSMMRAHKVMGMNKDGRLGLGALDGACICAGLGIGLAITLFPLAASAGGVLPSSGQYVAGAGNIAASGDTLTVNQSSARGIVNWQSFSIGAQNTVQINNGNGATLNRVTGGNLSEIDGHLNGTGTIYLINPNGVVVGAGGKVVTGGGFVASTRDESNNNFMQGGTQSFSGSSNGTVVNEGQIVSRNGDVVLIGHSVTNNGSISAPNGTAALASGNQVLLQPVNGVTGVFVAPDTSATGNTTNTGAIKAAAAALDAAGGNVYALAGNRTGDIQATGTQTIAGQVWLSAPSGTTEVSGAITAQNADGTGGTIVATGANTIIDSTAAIHADGTTGGTVLIGGDRAGGRVSTEKLVAQNVQDSQNTTIAAGAIISANGTKGSGGSVVAWSNGATAVNGNLAATGQTTGGYVETSGSQVTMAASANVSTQGETGQDGTWLIDPTDYTIAASGGDITGAQLSALLASNNIIIDSKQGETAATTATAGDILVDDAVSWSSAQTLTLNAQKDVVFGTGGNVTISGAGTLNANADDGATGTGTVIMNGGSITANHGGIVNFFYNPTSYTSPTAFTNVAVNVAKNFTAYMLVNTAAEFLQIATDLGGDYALNTNINLASSAVSPIGTSTPFSGILNGQNYTISNAAITDNTDGAVGLFSTNSGTIENLNLSAIAVAATGGYNSTGPANTVGGLAGVNTGTISNVTIGGGSTITDRIFTQSGNGPGAGMLVGENKGIVTGSSASGTVTGLGNVGGLVGWNESNNAVISSSFSTATVESNSNTATQTFATTYGGLVGWNQGGTIENSYSAGTVDLQTGSPVFQQDIQTGGFVGANTGLIQDSYSITPILVANGHTQISPFVGQQTGSVTNSYYDLTPQGYPSVVPNYNTSYPGGEASNAAGTGLTDAQAKNLSNYTGFSSAIWANGSGAYLYPTLIVPAAQKFYYPVTVSGLTAQNKVYDGTTEATLTGTYGLAGIYPGDPTVAATGTAGGAFATANVGNGIAVSYTGGLSLTGANAGNYLIAGFSPLLSANITPAQLTAAIINDPTMAYDGSAATTLPSGDVTLTGFVTGQGATANTSFAGSYNSPNVATANSVSAALTASDFTLNSGTLLSNYILPATATGAGAITPLTLSGSIINGPSMTYNGGTATTLPGNDVTLSGFLSGQGAAIGNVAGTYNSANVATASSISATLIASELTANSGTLLSNYILPTVTGVGTITPATLTASIINDPTKAYNGSVSTTLPGADIELSGFVTGQGAAANTSVAGSYNSPNVASANSVTAALTGSDFTANSGTSLSNYALPASATGAGAITPLALSGSIINDPTMVYDGSTSTVLPGSDITLTGFLSGQGADVAGNVAGSYNSADVATANMVSAMLTDAELSADTGTLLSNYTLPTVSGAASITPATLTASIVNDPTKTYDGSASTILPGTDIELSGFVTGQGAAADTSVAGNYNSPDVATANSITAALTGSDFAANSGTSLSNYTIPTTATGAGAIAQAQLTASIVNDPSMTYDGSTATTIPGTDIELSGFITGQGASADTSVAGSYNSADVATANSVTAALTGSDFAANSGTSLSNYSLPISATGSASITPLALSGSIINDPSMVYDGSAATTLPGSDVSLTGFVTGQGASVNNISGSYNSADVATANTISATLTAGDLSANSGTQLTNYTLPAISGAGSITPAQLTASILNDPTKTYDGTTAATLPGSDVALSGFVAGQGASADANIAGNYNSPNVATANAVTAALSGSDFAANSGTSLSNYTLPATASGAGAIAPATLTVSITNNPTKLFDGTTSATLDPSNFNIFGFVPGQGASVTQTAGIYASPQSGIEGVTADIDFSYFAPGNGTDLSNYTLSSGVAEGTGTILAAPPTDVLSLIEKRLLVPKGQPNSWWFVFSPKQKVAVRSTVDQTPAIEGQSGVVTYNLLNNRRWVMVLPDPSTAALEGPTP